MDQIKDTQKVGHSRCARHRARNRATFGRICSLAIKVFF
jgi:hypothetical protein